MHGNPIFSTRLINLSKPHPKVMKIISNNSKNNMKHKKFKKHKMESEMKFNLRQTLKTGTKNAAILIFLKFGGHFDFFKSFIYCKTTSNPFISTCVNKLMINYHSLRYFCGRFLLHIHLLCMMGRFNFQTIIELSEVTGCEVRK